MKEVYFRIIELESHQVLLQKDFGDDNEDNKPLIRIIFNVEGIKVSQSLGYDDEVQRDKIFESITEEQIQNTVDNALKMFQ